MEPFQTTWLIFLFHIKDPRYKDKYKVSGTLSQPTLNNYAFQLKPDSLLLNYEPWTINRDNAVQLLNGDIVANQFILSKGAQLLSLNSVGSGTNRPLSVDFKNFNISTLTAICSNRFFACRWIS